MARYIGGPIQVGGVNVDAQEPGSPPLPPVSAPTAWPLANQPTLGSADAGYSAYVTDYGHHVRWTGAIWEFAPGDVTAGFVAMFVIPPSPADWWQLCDGTQITYLVAGGATLTTSLFTTPNLVASERFLKTVATYTGNVQAAVGGGLTGTTDAEASHTHSVTTSNHTHTFSGTTGDGSNATITINSGSLLAVSQEPHTHAFGGTTAAGGAESTGTGAGSAHSHGAGTLAVDGTARPPSIGLMPYFRR